MKTKLPLCLALLLLTQCSKCKNADPAPQDPAAQLPPATQTGANTFGCLVNGQPYIPQGRVGLGPNFAVSYDPGFNGGDLEVRTYSIGSSGNDPKKTLIIGGDSIGRAGNYTFKARGRQGAIFLDRSFNSPCDDYDSNVTGHLISGNLNITRLDLQAGIVAGTFAFKLYQPGCDTLRVTQGRFDAKL